MADETINDFKGRQHGKEIPVILDRTGEVICAILTVMATLPLVGIARFVVLQDPSEEKQQQLETNTHDEQVGRSTSWSCVQSALYLAPQHPWCSILALSLCFYVFLLGNNQGGSITRPSMCLGLIAVGREYIGLQK